MELNISTRFDIGDEVRYDGVEYEIVGVEVDDMGAVHYQYPARYCGQGTDSISADILDQHGSPEPTIVHRSSVFYAEFAFSMHLGKGTFVGVLTRWSDGTVTYEAVES